nr:HAMP domain-containing protein [Actinomycetota bacterium]
MPIRWRLTLFNALAIGAILLVLGLALFFALREALLHGVEDTVRSRALAAARIVESGESLEGEEAERLSLDGVFLIVRDGEGKMLFHTAGVASPEEAEDPVWRRALEEGRPAGGMAELSAEPEDYVYAVPVGSPGQAARIVEAGQSYEEVEETLETFTAVLAFGSLAALLLSVGGAYLLARAALSPVGAVVDAAGRITGGDLSRRLPVANPNDEIGRLTRTINDLLERLEEAFARREEALSRQRRFVADASHELRTPLTSIGGYARMLEEWGIEHPETAREGAVAIRRESGRMRELVEGLLALARGDEGAPLNLELQD